MRMPCGSRIGAADAAAVAIVQKTKARPSSGDETERNVNVAKASAAAQAAMTLPMRTFRLGLKVFATYGPGN
jgi:hypothetical protein